MRTERAMRLEDLQNTSVSDSFPCEHCGVAVRFLVVGNKTFIVQEIMPPLYCTDAHGNIVGISLNLMPIYILHQGVALCHPLSKDKSRKR